MDPNELLKNLLALSASILSSQADLGQSFDRATTGKLVGLAYQAAELAEGLVNLDEWINQKHGFLPGRWAPPSKAAVHIDSMYVCTNPTTCPKCGGQRRWHDVHGETLCMACGLKQPA